MKQWKSEYRADVTMYVATQVAGAMLVENVHVYEMMKIRVLNGGHSAISCRACSPPLTTRDGQLDHNSKTHKAIGPTPSIHFAQALLAETNDARSQHCRTHADHAPPRMKKELTNLT